MTTNENETQNERTDTQNNWPSTILFHSKSLRTFFIFRVLARLTMNRIAITSREQVSWFSFRRSFGRVFRREMRVISLRIETNSVSHLMRQKPTTMKLIATVSIDMNAFRVDKEWWMAGWKCTKMTMNWLDSEQKIFCICLCGRIAKPDDLTCLIFICQFRINFQLRKI